MRKKKADFKVFENITIGPAVAEGNCIVRIENQVVFVKFAAPGDVADIQVTGKKKKFLQSRILKLIEPSEHRVAPKCEHYGICGGCKWQHLDYNEQLKFKEQQVVDAFERIGGIDGFEVLPIRGSEIIYGYRNKLELTFSNKGWIVDFNPEKPGSENALGFHIPGKFDKVLNIENCHLMPPLVNRISESIRKYCEENGYAFFDLREQTGLMRNVMFRVNSKGEWLVLIVFSKEERDKIQSLLKYLKSEFPDISELLYTINEKRNDTLTGLEIRTFFGNGYLTEKLGNFIFKIRPQSFFQTNTRQAEALYTVAGQFAGFTGTDVVYDLYTGTGSIALFISDKVKKVIGIEYVEEAVLDARENMDLNGISNCEFFSGDMKNILTDEFISVKGKPDVVITDPPRDGMHPDVVEQLLKMEVDKIVYISCNPSTQARDAALLAKKYDLVKIQPVDMFPHTHHVENVGLWVLKSIVADR